MVWADMWRPNKRNARFASRSVPSSNLRSSRSRRIQSLRKARTQDEVILHVPYMSSTAAGIDRMGIAICKDTDQD